MTRGRTIPLLPCPSIDEIVEFYGVLGFTQTYYQVRPNPYVAMRRGEIELHFCGIPGFDPAQSYGSCLVMVPDTGELYQSFAAGMRAAYGKVLISGVPRMTRPRKRRNTGDLSGFSVIDPGGNWIRIFSGQEVEGDPDEERPAPSKFVRSLQNAIVMGDSHGDHKQAARILDTALAREGDTAPPADLVEVLVYRAELALRVDDPDRAGELLARVHDVPLDDAERDRLTDALDNAHNLETALSGRP